MTWDRRLWIRLAALSGLLGVAAGAFGAHGAAPRAGELLKTGASYEMVHALAAIACMMLPSHRRAAPAAGLVSGRLGSVQRLALRACAGAPRIVGVVTPFGGLGLHGRMGGDGVGGGRLNLSRTLAADALHQPLLRSTSRRRPHHVRARSQMPPVAYADVNGVRLAYYEVGPRTGVPIILCHGFPELAFS